MIDEQQEQNSIEGREGSQILSATLPLIYMTDIKGTEDHWPPAARPSSKAVHHFIQERVRMVRAQRVFCTASVTLFGLAWRVSCVHAGHGVQKYPVRCQSILHYTQNRGIKWELCWGFFFNSTAPAKHAATNPDVTEAGFSQMLPPPLMLRWHYVNRHSLQITLMVTWWGVLGSRLTYKHRQIAD